MNIKRFQKTFEALNEFGYTKKGINRLAYSLEEQEALTYLIHLFEAEGLETTVDAIGNVIARREGSDPSLPSVACGSHIDTVYNGGKYDGSIGVLAGLELVRYLNEKSVTTEHPIEVIIFACEESARFGVSTVGSKALAGMLELEDVRSLKDKNGVTLEAAIKACGYDFERAGQLKRNKGEMKSYFELHIEQGPVLEELALPIGVVNGIAAPTRYEISVYGQAAHSGTTPMDYRKDAFTGASEIALALEEIVLTQAAHQTVATIGDCIVSPGAMNVVPDKTTLKVDIRSTSAVSKEIVKEKLLETVNNIGRKRNLQMEVTELSDEIPVVVEPEIIQAVKDACDLLKLPYKEMASGAGHDAMNMATICPIGMIFVPSKDGLSHNKDEYTSMSQIFEGIKVLTAMMMKEAGARKKLV